MRQIESRTQVDAALLPVRRCEDHLLTDVFLQIAESGALDHGLNHLVAKVGCLGSPIDVRTHIRNGHEDVE